MQSEKNKFEILINKFIDSQTCLDSYQIISDFMQAVFDMKNFREFAKLINREHKQLMMKKTELSVNKKYYENEERSRLSKAYHELDINFCLRNLHDVYNEMKPKNLIKYSNISFYMVSPDSPMPDYEKREYKMFMTKVFKKATPFLSDSDTELEIKPLEAIEKKEEAIDEKKDKMTENQMLKALGINKSTRYEDITVEFRDEHRVRIKANNKSYESDYEKLGFADKRKNIEMEAKPKSSWSLLNLFALKENSFKIEDLDFRHKEKFKKRKQELNKALKKIFQLEEDPIVYDKEKGEYRSRIKTEPAPEDREQWQDRDIIEKNN